MIIDKLDQVSQILVHETTAYKSTNIGIHLRNHQCKRAKQLGQSTGEDHDRANIPETGTDTTREDKTRQRYIKASKMPDDGTNEQTTKNKNKEEQKHCDVTSHIFLT